MYASLFLMPIACFNSSVVRLEDLKTLDAEKRKLVSIPVWCDWKTLTDASFDYILLFQFQCGAIGRR